MFCDHCGAPLQSGEPRCVRCGKVATGLAELRRNRVRSHIRLLGILWIAYSALHLVAGVFMLLALRIFGHSMHFSNGLPPEGVMLIHLALRTIGWLVLAKAVVGFIAGWGLLQREDWARTVSLVMGFIALLSVPVGTGLGIYTLWVLLPQQSDEEYRALAQVA